MTIWANQIGTQTATISTEHTLAQNSGANNFQFSVDTTNMVNGDITELRVYRIINATARQVACGIYSNIQASPLKEYRVDASQGVANGIKVTLKQMAGTGRAFDWELLNDSSAAAANVTQWLGTAVTAATAGIPDVNTKNINNVAAATPGASGGILISGSNSGTTTLAALTVTGSTTLSDGLLVSRSSSNTSAITATGNGTGSGIVATSGSGATGDGVQMTAASTAGNGLKLTKTGSGVDFNAQTTNSLQVNATQIGSQTASAAGTVTFPGTVASATNITAGTITTVTNLTNAPTAGDFTATMKTSLNSSTPTSVTTVTGNVNGNVGGNVTGTVGSVVGAVGSVTGNVGGNVTGSVGSVVGAVGSVTGAVGSVTGNIGGNVVGSVASVTAAVTVSGTSALTESYAAAGAGLTLAQSLYGINQFLSNHATSGTTWTVKKRDGSTTAKTYTLDSATAPTSLAEAT